MSRDTVSTGFSGTWHFPTIGLELNLDLILGMGTGQLPYTAGMTIGTGSAGGVVTGGSWDG